MDPMDFVLHQHHPRPSGHYDPVHAPSGPWIPHPQTSPAYQWSPHPSGLPQPYPHPLQQVPGDPFFFAHNGLPPPMSGFHGAPAPDSFPGMPNRRVSHSSHRQSWRGHGRPTQPLGSHPGSNNQDNDGSFVNQPPVNRLQSFQPAANPTVASQPPSSPSDLNSLPRSHFTTDPDSAGGVFLGQLSNSQFQGPAPPSTSFIINPSRPSHRSLSSSSTRIGSADAPAPTRHSPSSPGPRRTSRARRTMAAATSRTVLSGTDHRTLYLELQELLALREQGLTGAIREELEDEIGRRLQIYRSPAPAQKGASKSTINSLLRVKIDELPEEERCCSICYNDFGVESPEKYTEAPVRLPKCKHVFGDFCIKQWLAESHHCPYCRDELPQAASQPVAISARAFLATLRAQTSQGNRQPMSEPSITTLSTAEIVPAERSGNNGEQMATGRVAASQIESRHDLEDDWQEYLQQASDESSRRAANDRRSPPIDANGQERRTRPRHNHRISQSSGVHSSMSAYPHPNVLYERPTNSMPGSTPDPSPRAIIPPMPQGTHWSHTPAPRPSYPPLTPTQLPAITMTRGWGSALNTELPRLDPSAPSRNQILPNPLQSSRFAVERHNRENIPPSQTVTHLSQDSNQNDHGSTNSTTVSGFSSPRFGGRQQRNTER